MSRISLVGAFELRLARRRGIAIAQLSADSLAVIDLREGKVVAENTEPRQIADFAANPDGTQLAL